jgi:hypothetical protein
VGYEDNYLATTELTKSTMCKGERLLGFSLEVEHFFEDLFAQAVRIQGSNGLARLVSTYLQKTFRERFSSFYCKRSKQGKGILAVYFTMRPVNM